MMEHQLMPAGLPALPHYTLQYCEGIGHDDHGGLDGGSDDAEGLELRSHHSGNTSYTGDRDSQYCCRLRAGLVECSIHAVSV
eukprot:scaffold95395_cov19-Tisochrysis_lutea.AAC.1